MVSDPSSQPPKKEDKKGGKSKQIQAAKAAAGGGKSSGGKGKKKKWSKGKVREKLSNMVVFDKATFDKLVKEVPSYRLITPAVVSERLKVNGSLARRGIKELLAKGLIRPVAVHGKSKIYTRAIVKEEEVVDTKAAGAKAPAKAGKKAAAKPAAEKPAAAAPTEVKTDA